MFAWAGATASWLSRTNAGGTRGLDDYLTLEHAGNIGAEILGRKKFGRSADRGRTTTGRGWWGDEPPSHTPVSS